MNESEKNGKKAGKTGESEKKKVIFHTTQGMTPPPPDRWTMLTGTIDGLSFQPGGW